MPITNKTGDILTSKAEVIVIPVNCVGVMGAGLAKAAKAKWPDVAGIYKDVCKDEALSPGEVYPIVQWQKPKAWLAATKDHWKNPSRIEWIDLCLADLARSFRLVYPPVSSIALPRLGCGCGGLNWADVEPLVHKHLGGLDCNVEVWSL